MAKDLRKPLTELVEHIESLIRSGKVVEDARSGPVAPKLERARIALGLGARDPVQFPYRYHGWIVEQVLGHHLGCRGSVRNARGFVATRDGDLNHRLIFKPSYGHAPTLEFVRKLIDSTNASTNQKERKATNER